MTILSSSRLMQTQKVLSTSSKSLLQGLSNSASLEENLMVGRPCSISGQKRKQLEKQKRASQNNSRPSSPVSPQCYSHVLVNSNSVNFHDYAMSPSSDMSLETGRTTVLSKRIYRKKPYQFDGNDKEKQHHHNQLERNRRQKLANLYHELRDEIPKIASHSKASKVVILKEATTYITELRRTGSLQENEMSNLLQKQLNLKKQLVHLQANRY